MKYTDFERIISEYGLGRIHDSEKNLIILVFKNKVAIGNIQLTKKINRSILWLSKGPTDTLNHIKEEDLRERLKNIIKQLKENVQRERIISLNGDF